MVMFINEFDYYFMDMAPNVCSIQFPGVPNCFDYRGICQRSSKIMNVGKRKGFKMGVMRRVLTYGAGVLKSDLLRLFKSPSLLVGYLNGFFHFNSGMG